MNFSKIRTMLILGCALAISLGSIGSVQAQDWKLGIAFFKTRDGVLKISHVFPNSPAQEMGLKPGYKVISIQGKLVNDPISAKKLIDTAGANVALVYHDGERYVEVGADLAVAAYRNSLSKVKNIRKRIINNPR